MEPQLSWLDEAGIEASACARKFSVRLRVRHPWRYIMHIDEWRECDAAAAAV